MRPLVVVQSPLGAKDATGFQRNLRYLCWCMRAEVLVLGNDPVASHLGAPWYLDDTVPRERELGYSSGWFWQSGKEHHFWTDCGMSGGMKRAERQIRTGSACGVGVNMFHLRTVAPGYWAAFERGEWPPHTPGFELDAPEAERGSDG